MSRLDALVRLTLKGLLGGRRLLAAVALALLPLALGGTVLWIDRALDVRPLTPRAFYGAVVPYYYHVFLILAAALFGTSAVADDEEDGSVVYLLVRPVRRGLVYLGKVSAAAVATALLVLPSLVLVWALLVIAGDGRRPEALTLLADLAWLALGAAAYPAAFACFAAAGRRPLQLVAGFLVLWELPMAFAPTALRHLTVSHHLLSLMPHPSSWHAIVLQFGGDGGPLAATAGALALTVAYLALGALRYDRREHLAGPPA